MLVALAPFEKAALFVVSLGRYIGPEVLARLQPAELELLRIGLSGLRKTGADEIELLHHEFLESYSMADALPLRVFAYLKRFLDAHPAIADTASVIQEIALDSRGLSQPLSVEQDRRFLFEFIRELEDAREIAFPDGDYMEWTLRPIRRMAPALRPAARAVQRQPELAATILQNWLSGNENYRPITRQETLSGPLRMALLLRSFSPETAAILLQEADEERLRQVAFQILCAEDLSPALRESVLVETTEILLYRGLIPGTRESRAREIARLLRCPDWFCDLLRDLVGDGDLDPREIALSSALPGTPTMRRELARACSHAVRRQPVAVYHALALHLSS